MNVAEPGLAGDTAHDPADVMSVQSAAIDVDQQSARRRVLGGPLGDQPGRVGMQRDVAVVVQFADRDT